MNVMPDHRASRAAADQRLPFQVSFEFFPPKTDVMEARFWESISKLAPLHPRFVSVTYGAGGSTRERTLRLVSRIKAETGVDAAAHLTCVGASRAEVDAVVAGYRDAGISRIIALRGDPPEGVGQPFVAHPEGYGSAAELVAGISRLGDFDISVAAYTEKHPQSPDWATDIDNLKRKLDAGATRGISQFFFDADVFLRFRDRMAAAGVTAPLVPGIMPLTNYKGLSKMAAGCGASVPAWIGKLFDGLDDDPDTRRLVAAAAATELCAQLAAEGVEDFHFYTLNRADLTLAICRVLGVHSEVRAA